MATEAETPEPLSITKREGEEKDLTSMQLDRSVDEYCPGELKKVEGEHNQPPETVECSTNTDTMQAAIHKGNVGTLEGEIFLESPSVSNVASEETCRVSEHHQADEISNQAEKEASDNETKLQENKKFEAAEETGRGKNKVLEEIKERAEKGNESLDIVSVIETGLQKTQTEEPALNIEGEETSEKQRVLDRNIEITAKRQASVEENPQRIEEAMSGSHKDEEGGTKTDENTDSESSKQYLDVIEATSIQNKEASDHSSDLTVDCLNKDVETVTEVCNREESIKNIISTKTTLIQEELEEEKFFEGGEDMKSEKSSNIVDIEQGPEAISPSEKIKDAKGEGEQIPSDGIRDVSISTLTENPDIQNDDEAILEIGEGAKDRLDSPPLTLLKEKTPVEDEIQDKNNLDTPFVIETEEMCLQKVEKPDIFKEVSTIGSENVVKESQKEVEEQTEILERTTQADRLDSTTSEKGKGDENPEQNLDGSFIKHEEIMQSKDNEMATIEASAGEHRNEEKLTVIVAEENISTTETVKAEEHGKMETSKHEEDPDQSFMQHDEPKMENLERSLNVISEMMETDAPSENAETITCVKEERSIKNLEEGFEEKAKEDKPTDAVDISKHGISEEKNFQLVDLNKKIESAEVEIPEKNVDDLHATHLLVEETNQVECENLDKVSKFEPQEEVNEANGAPEEEGKQIEKASEACKSTESTALEYTSTEEAATQELIPSKADPEKLQKIYGLDSEEKLEIKDAEENIEEETQKNEEAFDAEMHQIATKSDDTEKGIIEEDAPEKVCSTVGSGEMVEQSLQVESLEEVAPELKGGDKSYKAEDDVEKNNIIDEEVHDRPKITGMGEITKEHIIEGNVRPSEQIKDEKEEGKQIPYDGIRDVSISTLTENPDIQNDEEAILEIGERAKDKLDSPHLILLNDETPVEDEIQDKNLDTPFVIQTEEMCLQKVEKPEVFKEVSEIGSKDVVKESSKEVENPAQADSTTSGKGNDDENPEQNVDESFIKYEESVQSNGEGLATTEDSAGDNRNDEKFTTIVAEDTISNTEIVEAEEHREKETSKQEEDPDQSFLQRDEPKMEKLERSLNVISEMMETSISSENAETIACVKEERSVKNLEESFEEKGKEDKPTDTDDISEHGISKEKNFPPVDLNENIESAEVEIPEKNVNDLHVTHSLVEERDQVECEKLDEVSKFEPQEEVNEANGASAEEEMKIEEASEACKSTESTTLDHTSTEGAETEELISSDAEKLQKNYGLECEEKLEAEDAGKIIEEEAQKNEEAFDAEMHKIATKKREQLDMGSDSIESSGAGDDTEKGIINEDALAGVCSTVGAGDETVEPSFQVESLEEAAPKLSDDTRSYKAEDDVEKNNIIDKEVDDGDEDNITRLVKVKENSEKETSKDDEDAKQILLQRDEPGEKLERSLNVISEETEEGVSSENADKITCIREEATVQNLEETLEKEMKEEEAKDIDDTKENGIAKEEDLEQVAETSVTSKSTESTILEMNSNESEIEVEKLKKECELDSKEVKDASENREEEIKNEETSDICLHKVETKCAGDETVKQSFQVESLEEAAPELSGNNTSYKAEDDVERNNITDEEVHDGPKIIGTEEATKEHIIEGNIRHISTESIEEETVKSFQDNEKEAKRSEGGETKEHIIEEGNLVDISPETVAEDPIKNFQDDEKEAKKFEGEIFEDSETAEAGESIAHETNQDDKNPDRISNDSSVKQEETLPTEAPKEEKREEDGSSVVDTRDEDNITRLVKVKENSETETSKDDEDDKQILQQEEPDGKLEQSLNEMSKLTEEDVSSENVDKIACEREEAAVQNLEQILEKEVKEEAKDTDDTKENGIAKEEDLEQVTEASETSRRTESTILELNSKESKIEVEKLKKGCELDSKEELEGKDASENIEEEIKNEETSDLCLHKVETKCAGDETVEESFQVESLEEADPELSGDDKSYKAEDDIQRNNIIAEEVHDGPKITGTGEVTKEHFIEDNVRHISPESIEEETIKSFQDNEKEAEKSKAEDTEEQIIEEGNVIDLSPESTAEDPVKNFQDDEMEAEKFKGEIFEESETAEAGESIAHEKHQEDENPERILYASSEKQEERLQGEGENLSPTEAPKEEKREEDRSSVVDTKDEDNITRLVKVKENGENETSKDDEDDKQILPQDEPDEKLEQTLNVVSKETEEGVSSENADKITCEREKAAVQNLEEILEKEMKEEAAKDTDDTKENGIAKEEDLEQVAEASETSKSAESTIFELKNESEIEVEKLKKGCELDSTEELEGKDASENIEEETKNEETSDLCLHKAETKRAGDETDEQSFRVVSLEEAAPELSGDNKSYKAEDDVQRNNIIDEEVHDGPKITTTGEVIKEHLIESDVRYISPESIKEETDKIFQENEKEAEKSEGEETKEQIIQECNVIDLSPESVAKGPVKSFQEDEKEAKKFKREIFEESPTAKVGENIAREINQDDESLESIVYASSVKQQELQEGENLCPTKDSNEDKRDEDGSSVLVTGDEDNITGLVKAKENTEKETSKDEEDDKQILQQDEPGKMLERSLHVMPEETEEVVSSENAEKITCMRQEASVQNLEETSEKEMKEEEKDTHATKEDGIAKEDLELVSEASDTSKSTESAVLELNLKESEIEVEKLEGCELDSKEELEGKNASENMEEKTKNKETSDLCLHKFETENASAEKSIIAEDATVKNSSTVCIGGEVVELSCQEDENMQKSTKEAEPKTNGGDQSYKTDNETENLKHQFVNEEVYEDPMIASKDEDTDKHIIQEEHTVTDISQEVIGEETSKSLEEDEKEEEKPKVEMWEELETASVSEAIEKQNLDEENTIQNRSIESARAEINEESSKEDDMVVKMPREEVCEIIQAANGGENTGKHIMEEDSVVRDDFEVFETTSAGQDIREQIIEEIDSFKGHSPESIEKEALGESSNKDEEGEGFKTAPSTTNIEKQNKEKSAIPDLSSLSVEEETVKESSKEDESNAVQLKEEIEAIGSTEETKLETLKDRTETNKDLGALNTIETSEEETPLKESSKSLVEHSLVSKMSKKEMKTEILETEEPTINDSDSALITVVPEEKCLKGAEPEGKKQNLESSDLGEKLECTSKSLAEDQSDKPLPEISKAQIEENNDVHHNTKSVEQQISGQEFQEGKKQMNDEAESKLEAEDHMKETQSANETIKDVILTEKVPEESEKADENENIKEQIIQEESDTKEFHTVSTGDETDNEVKNSAPVSIENLKPTDSKEQIETINLEVEEDLDREKEASPLTKASEKETMEKGDNEKPVDVSISVSEVSEEKIKEEIVERVDTCYDKMDTASVTVVTEEKSLEEPQPDDKHEKAFNDGSQEVSKDEEILDSGGSNKNADGLPITHSLGEDILPEVGEKCEVASNIELDKMEKAHESASKVQSHDVLTESEETIKEEHLEAAMTELRAEENQFEANEIINNEVSNEEITEQTEIAKESHSVSLGEETIKEIHQEDELMTEEHPGEKTNETFRTTKNGIQNDELSEEIEKTGASENIIKQITHEDRALRDSYPVSVEDKTITESLPNEAERGDDEEAAIKLNLENQSDTTNFINSKTEATTQSEEVNMELEKHDLDTLGTNENKETAITKSEEGPDSNLSLPPETNAAAKEALHEKVGDEIEKASEPYPKDGVHETNIIYRENKEIATAVADNPESLMEDEKHRHPSLELAWDGTDVKEDLKLKGQEVCDNKPGTSSINENSQEEIPDKTSKFREDDEKQYDSVFDKKTEAEVSITAEGKGIKAEREYVKDEEPIEVSTWGNERKPDEAEIHSTICANKDREIQYQSEKPDDLIHIQDKGLVVSQKEGSVVFAETNETTQEIQKLEKTSHSISEKQILGENPIDITETMVSTANKDALREPGNASEIESELNEETTKESTSKDTAKFSLSNLLQRSTKETLQRAGQETEEKELTANKEEMQTEEVETLKVEAAKTDEEKDEEEEDEEEDEHKKADSGSDAPVMVEASRDMDVKVSHKKSHHNILSGVGSKVKHSIAKVKKAITGKSSHPKTQSPK